MRKALGFVGTSILALAVGLPVAVGAVVATPTPTPKPTPVVTPVANPLPTIAIIDTAINAAQYSNIVHEACFNYNTNCPNGQTSMDGPGAANLSPALWAANNIDHGEQVVGTALIYNPKVKIVFVRIADAYLYQGKPITSTQLSSIDRAISWVADNFQKYGINAVSISQEAIFGDGTCRVDATLTAAVEKLKAGNVPVLAGVGNNAYKDRTAFPACSPDVIGVGSSTPSGGPMYFSNLGKGVQLMAQGSVTVQMPASTSGTATVSRLVAGTSISTPTAATLWSTYFSGTWDNQVAQMKKLPTIVDQYKNSYYWIK